MKYHLFFSAVFLSTTVTTQVIAVDAGSNVPVCSLAKLGNPEDSVDLRRYHGQVLYVDFWASWCGPCAKSFPYMNHLERTATEQGLRIVAVNLDENIEDAREFLAKSPASFTVALDAGQQCAKSFDVQAMPSTYLIDRKGKVRYLHMGFRSGEIDQLQSMVERLLAEGK